MELTPEIHMEGTSNLVGLDLHLTREKLRELFRTLEEKKRVLQLLDRFFEQRGGELAVQVGLADVHPSMGEIILDRYLHPAQRRFVRPTGGARPHADGLRESHFSRLTTWARHSEACRFSAFVVCRARQTL